MSWQFVTGTPALVWQTRDEFPEEVFLELNSDGVGTNQAKSRQKGKPEQQWLQGQKEHGAVRKWRKSEVTDLEEEMAYTLYTGYCQLGSLTLGITN